MFWMFLVIIIRILQSNFWSILFFHFSNFNFYFKNGFNSLKHSLLHSDCAISTTYICNFNNSIQVLRKMIKKIDQKRDPKGTFRLLYLKVPFSEDFSLLADQTFLSFYHNSHSSRLNDNVYDSQTFLSSAHNLNSSRRMTTLVRCGC